MVWAQLKELDNPRLKLLDLFDFCRRVDARKMNKRVLESLIKAGAFDKIGPHRASIMASLPVALQQAEQNLRNQTTGQSDLFGNSTTVETPSIAYLPAQVLSDQQRLLGEKETLGLYFTGHPIHRYLLELKNFTTARIADLRPQGAQSITAAGIIASLRLIQTKRGDRMAVATIEDDSSQIDVLCFSETFSLYRDLLVKDQLIVVEGEVSVDEFSGGYRMMCREVFSIEQARARHAKFLRICLPQYPSEDIEKVAGILSKFRGGRCSVKIDYVRQDAAASFNLGEDWRIHPSDNLLETLQEALTENSVEMIY
jgi:DNA polymerase-3 subunit alpha